MSWRSFIMAGKFHTSKVGHLSYIKSLCEPETNLAPFDNELSVFSPFSTVHRAALPQVILAQWYDLSDNANRTEYRGIGIYENRSVAPDIDADEFSAAPPRVVGNGPEAEGHRSRVLKISGLCRAAGGEQLPLIEF
jgi:hypothetical protein